MDERKSDDVKPAAPSLQAAIRRARVESAEQSQAVADLREAEVARLELLLDAIRPVLDQAPEGVELFDPGITFGERPRLFLDMIGFVDLGHDRRTYRFFQDTRHGRVLIAESVLIERIAASITNYVARRLVEREQALASDWRSRAARVNGVKANVGARRSHAAETPRPHAVSPPAEAGAPLARRRWLTTAGDLFSYLLMTLGSIALIALVCLGVYAAWNAWGRALWMARFGPSPI